jgi:hypothetical protein
MTRLDPRTGRIIREPEFDPFVPETIENESEGFADLAFDFGADLLLAAPRAAEGLGRSILDLGAAVIGEDTRYSERRSDFLGRSETILGGFVEGGLQFLVPFTGALKGINAARFATKGPGLLVRGLGLMTGGKGRFARNVAAGAAGDFFAFGGHEQRLSNFLAKVPGLQQPVFDYLATKEDDGEIEGRLKAVLEGAGIGAAFDGVFAGIKAIKNARAKKAGATPLSPPSLKKIIKETEAEMAEKIRPLREANDALALTEAESIPETLRAPEPPKDPNSLSVEEMLNNKLSVAKKTMDQFLITEDEIKGFTEAFDKAVDDGFLDYLAFDPKDMPDDVKAFMGAGVNGGLDLSMLKTDKDADLLIRQVFSFMEEKFGPLQKKRSDNVTQALMTQELSDILAKDPDEFVAGLAKYVDKASDVEILPGVLHTLVGGAANRASAAINLYTGRSVDPKTVARMGFDITPDTPLEEVLSLTLKEVNRGAMIQKAFVGVRGSAGRMLRNMQQETEDVANLFTVFGDVADDIDVTNAKALIDELGKDEVEKRLEGLAKIGELDSISMQAAATRLSKMTTLGKITAVSTEWMISNMLWSAKTFTTNAVFPTMASVYVPIENMVGGALTGNTGLIKRELRTLQGMSVAIGDAVRAGWDVARGGTSKIDPRATKARELGLDQSVFNSKIIEAAGWNPGTIMGSVIDAIGRFTQVPGRIMQGSDEFVKTMTARGHGVALLTEEAQRQGKDVTAYVTDTLPKLFDDGHLVVEEHIEAKVKAQLRAEGIEGLEAGDALTRAKELKKEISAQLSFDELNPITTKLLERGREATATSPLDGAGAFDTTTRHIQEFVSKHPMMRMVLPFVTTPANIAKFAGQRTGAVFSLPSVFYSAVKGEGVPKSVSETASRFIKDIHSGDKTRSSEAIGRLATGTGIFALAMMKATEGTITGAGPEDPEQRRLMEEAGWQPYSMRVGDKYVSYHRADPFATMIGLAADMHETAQRAYSEEGEGDIQALSLGLIASISNNITNKTYMTGLSRFLDAVTDPVRNGGKFLGSLAGATTPRFFQQTRDLMQDPVMRDTHGLLGKLRARVPFMGTNPPMRNMMGEPIRKSLALGAVDGAPASYWMDMFMPSSYREVSDDAITKEMASLRHGFNPPARSRFGLRPDNYTNAQGQDAYDRWSELHGKVKVDGKTIRQTLRKTIQSKDYLQLDPRGNEFEQSPRVGVINSVIQRFRRQAWEAVLDEYPDLAADWHALQKQRRSLRSGTSVSNLIGSVDPFKL